MSRKIPPALVLAAREYGCNNLKYLGTLNGFSVYIEYQKYSKKMLPIFGTGIPVLFIWNGTEATCVCSDDVPVVLDKLERRTIPAAVKKAAKSRRHLGGTLEKVARYNNKDIYTYIYDEPMTIGMPELYILDGAGVEVVGGEETLQILSADNIEMYADLTKNGAGLFDMRVLSCYKDTTHGLSIADALIKYHLTAKQYKDNKRRVIDSLKGDKSEIK